LDIHGDNVNSQIILVAIPCKETDAGIGQGHFEVYAKDFNKSRTYRRSFIRGHIQTRQ